MLFFPASRMKGGASVRGFVGAQSEPVASRAVAEALARRREGGLALAEHAEAVSREAATMAATFGGSGKLIAFGNDAGEHGGPAHRRRVHPSRGETYKEAVAVGMNEQLAHLLVHGTIDEDDLVEAVVVVHVVGTLRMDMQSAKEPP